ncbi:mediator of RNA polymerase II transcription subunit 29 [Microplitis demolitor]|uniref:mediator of RNA polymerase II transcription subunit 29 n=1 Tax=Microplitis demolitor TaxID=69319 RepID=UPI00043FFF70|nr:mediator of RNA polymerase II transcription subunit 29 [Microplitis demolitor]XP_014295740.1 mediator of RNA polymerase II transcription subunit 29 [Microplitis demolitor]
MMNISSMQQQGGMAMGQMPQPSNPQMAPNPQQAQQVQQQQALQQQQQQQQQQTQEKLDNISKVKSLVGPLRESLAIALKTAANTLTQNSLVDVGSSKSTDSDHRFNKNMEEFYSICDQIELHLKTSIECLSQNASSVRYFPMPVMPTRTEAIPAQEGPALTYPQFLMTVKAQVSFLREIHDALMTASNSLTSNE